MAGPARGSLGAADDLLGVLLLVPVVLILKQLDLGTADAGTLVQVPFAPVLWWRRAQDESLRAVAVAAALRAA